MLKRNKTTIEAIQEVSKATKISFDDISYAGNKDKRAITLQLITIPKISVGNPKSLEDLKLKDISLKFVGYTKEKLTLGKLKGNEFEITVRNISKYPKIKDEIVFPNYFDEQRFSKNNAIIGKNILMGKYDEAIKGILSYSYSDKELEAFGYWRDFDMSKADKNSRNILNHLLKYPKDYVGSIRKIPLNTALMFIHSFQSLIFNRVLSKTIQDYFSNTFEIELNEKLWATMEEKRHAAELKIPLVGFATDPLNYQMFNVDKNLIIEMEREGVRFKDFVVRSYPLLTESGSDRLAFVKVKIDFKKKDDDSAKLVFRLPSGSYATTVVKTIFGSIGEKVESYSERKLI